MAEGSAKLIKCALFLANASLAICGILAIVIGVWTLVDRSFIQRFLPSDLFLTTADLLIVLGVIVTIICGLGCIGAMKENKCMLLTFFIILLLILVGMFVAIITAYVFKSQLQAGMHEEMEKSISYYGNNTELTESWDFMQEYFKCCGLITPEFEDSYQVWKKNDQFQGDKQVPESCCKEKDESSIKQCQSNPKKNTYNEDCYIQMKDFAKDHALMLAGIGIGISVILVIGMVLSMALYMMINRHERGRGRTSRFEPQQQQQVRY